MYLFQLLIPVKVGPRHRKSQDALERIQLELTRKFGGVTAYVRSPAEGLWKGGGRLAKDQVVMVEVMSSTRSLDWWKRYKAQLENRLAEEKVLIRFSKVNAV